MIENENEIDYQIYKSFEVLGLIGKGTYGQVYKVKHKKSQQIFAIKKICDVYQNITDAKRTYRELNYLFQLAHPCIVKLYQVIPTNKKNYGLVHRQTNTSRTQFFKGLISQESNGYNTEKIHDTFNMNNNKISKHVYALFEFVQTDLSKALRLCRMELIQRKYITYQLLHGLAYLHKSKLIHRDIKPSNILIDSNCDVKICDFGLCRLKQNAVHQRNEQNIITEYVASRWYRPPQILLGFSPCNQAIDVWGIGCVMAELILRQPLFQGGTTMDQLQKIFRLIGLPTQNDISQLQTEHAKFILRNFTFSRKNKPQKINEILGEASDQELDLIEKLLKFNPQERLSASDALNHPFLKQMTEMNYNFQSYSFPVKLTDQTQPSTFMTELRTFNQDQKYKKCQKSNKKKQITLEQYQSLIEQLQRATSRSSNRGYQQNIYKKQDKIIEVDSKNKGQFASQQYLKEKSTRESNFLIEHKKFQKQKQEKDQQKSSIENHVEKLKYITSTQKAALYSKQNRNAYSTNTNYLDHQYPNFEVNKEINMKKIVDNAYQQNFNISYNNKIVEENLQEHYSKFLQPFSKQSKGSLNHKNTDEIQNDKNCTKNEKLLGKKNMNKIIAPSNCNTSSINKSKSKINENKNEKSLNSKYSSKNTNHPNLSGQNKQKYASYSSFNYQYLQKNQNQNQSKEKVQQTFKKNVQKQQTIKNKDNSKSKNFSATSIKSSSKHVNLKSNENLKNDSSLNKLSNKKDQKKSKQFATFKQNQVLLKQVSVKNAQNCFTKIQIAPKKQKNSPNLSLKNIEQIDVSSNAYYLKNHAIFKDPHKKSTNDLKKTTTLQKKSKKNPTSKSIGKKKSQNKTNSTLMTVK